MSTLSQIRTLSRVFISQTDENNTDFDNSTLNGFANEGVRFLGALVKKPIDLVGVQVENNIGKYNLPTDAVLILSALFGDRSTNNDVRPLQIVPLEELKSYYPSWLDSTSNSTGRPEYITLLDRRTVLITPRPDSTESASGKKLFINYCYQPATLSNDSDSPDLPIVYHDLVAKYVQHMCMMSKLNQPELGVALYGQIVEQAKKLESLIIKDSNELSFGWGSAINPESDGFSTVIP